MEKIAVMCAGSWGTAIAQVAANAEKNVMLWARESSVVDSINADNENTEYLPGISLNPAIRATASQEEALKGAEAVFMVAPAQHTRSVLEQMKPYLPEAVPIVLCAKGIEVATGLLMSQVATEIFPDSPYLVLSGPTFAGEVAKGLPAAATLATHHSEIGKQVAEAIRNKSFRPYVTSDPLGAEIGGAVKNVIAVACGIVYGRKLGENARAAIMTRGMAEIKRMGMALGAKPETFLGLSGMGDLTLTCNSLQSRNFSLGVMCGEGQSLNEILTKSRQVIEGVATANSVLDFAKKNAVDMPICQAVNDTLHNGVSVDETVEALMSRPLTQEF